MKWFDLVKLGVGTKYGQISAGKFYLSFKFSWNFPRIW